MLVITGMGGSSTCAELVMFSYQYLTVLASQPVVTMHLRISASLSVNICWNHYVCVHEPAEQEASGELPEFRQLTNAQLGVFVAPIAEQPGVFVILVLAPANRSF
ncbi:hypothetical protein [Tritonibacter mobilis]|uniref:hypothetical protein n=1 Tax=Tritonibacter mobilis TaxID=379347 RepID=UPI003A5B9A89